MADFGWSADCIVQAIKIAGKVRRALLDAGATESQYKEALDFLDHIAVVLKHLKKRIETNPDFLYRQDILDQLKSIGPPWK